MAAEDKTGTVPGWRGSGWIIASSVALLATSRWLSATSVEYLVMAATATAVAAALAPSLAMAHRRWAAVCIAALAFAIALGASTQSQLARLRNNWSTERERMARAALQALGDRVHHSADRLQRYAGRALDAPRNRTGAFQALSEIPLDEDASGAIVLFRGDSAVAWGGRPRVMPNGTTDSVGVIASPFYLALYAAAGRDDRRAVAMELLYTVPPADRLAGSIGAAVAERSGVAGFRFSPPTEASSLGEGSVISASGRPLFFARAELSTQGEVEIRLIERARLIAGVLLALALACFVLATWREHRGLRWRTGLVALGLGTVALTPLSAFSNYSRLFDPSLYFTPLGGPLTANAAALALTSALVLLTLLTAVRRQARVADRRLAVAIVLLVAGLGPFLLRDLARGIAIPAYGASAALWLIWEVPLFLAAVSVMLAGAAAGSAALGSSRGLPPIVAPTLASIAALIAPVVWQAPGQWPWWYTFLWIAAIASLAISRRTSAVIVAAATVAALGATTLVWGATTRARVRLAEADVATLGSGDAYARSLAERLGRGFSETPAPSRRALLEGYATSDLAAAGFPTAVATWQSPVAPMAAFATASLGIPMDSLRALVVRAATTRETIVADLPGNPSLEHAVAVPTDSGVSTIVVAPKSLLITPDPFSRLFGIEATPETEPPYTVQIITIAAGRVRATQPVWRRESNELHGDWIAPSGNGRARIHVEVELRPLYSLVQRGTLIVLLNLAIVGLLWLTSVLADGIAIRWIAVRQRRWARSYRIRLTLALFAFFMVPAIAFAIWSYQQLSADAATERELVVRETLKSATPIGAPDQWLGPESRRLKTPLFSFDGGVLEAASDSLLEEVAPIGRLLDAEVAEAMMVHGEVTSHKVERVAQVPTLFGYRDLDALSGGEVLAAPARADELALGRRARDLGILVLFATAIGALAALWLSGIAARQLASPIGSLRQAALSLAAGEREPTLEGTPTSEFLPVFAAFRRMVSDLNASRSALEEATRRTAAVLRNVASGVIAVNEEGEVTLANPRADELLGAKLPPGTRIADIGSPELAAIVKRFVSAPSEDEEFEMRYGSQQWRGRLTRLPRGGAVVTVEDVTEIARAERVLAWGEMARQVAHEIKNPLTPIRLGVQHLKRARTDARVDFDHVLDQNVERILKEIDHLDEIARAFSRYGEPPEQRGGAEPTDVAAVLRDLVGLESMGEGSVRWSATGVDREVLALARKDELREVLLNVFENARHAKATSVQAALANDDGRVEIAVEDDGQGIPEHVLPRIFEPHFSTKTSGSGLGLAISRRLIESWGGTIEITSRGHGARVTISLVGK